MSMGSRGANPARLPGSVVAVAVLFIAFGVIGLLDVIATLGQGRVPLNPLMLGLLIGPGLLRRRAFWRTIGLVFSAVGAIAGLLVGLAVAIPSEPHPIPIRFFGRVLTHASPTQAGALLVLLGLISATAFDVLRRAATKAHFEATEQ
jgi:hypothetical protein